MFVMYSCEIPQQLGYLSGYIRDSLEGGIFIIRTFVSCIEYMEHVFMCCNWATARYIQFELIPAEEIKLSIQISIQITPRSEV